MKFYLLCNLGIHRPLTGHKFQFIDKVSGKSVYSAKCPCGKVWLVDSPLPMPGFKSLLEEK